MARLFADEDFDYGVVEDRMIMRSPFRVAIENTLMSTEVTLTLPEEILKRAESVARKRGRPVPEILVESIEMALDPSAEAFSEDESLSEWTDAEVLDAADSLLPSGQSERLSELLELQRERRITPAEKDELQALMRLYEAGQLRKARGLAEAVHRKLRPPPLP